MTALLRSPRLHLALRLLLGAYFVYASLDKIADPAAFARAVYQWQVLPPVPANLLAVTLPWVEILAGGLLILGVWRREAALVTAVMLVVFLVAAGSVIARGIDVENCGCTSLARSEPGATWPPPWTRGVGWYLIVQDLALLGTALLLLRASPTTRAWAERGAEPEAAAPA